MSFVRFIYSLYIFLFLQSKQSTYSDTRIGGVMLSMLAQGGIDRRFGPRSGQTKFYNIDICCMNAEHASLRSKSKVWLVQNRDNVPKWSDMPTHRLLSQWASTIKIQLNLLAQYKSDITIVLSKCNLYSPWLTDLELTITD